MSKRFGRNQRRRAREALAAAQAEREQFRAAHRMAEELLREQSRKLAEANYVIAEAKEIAGQLSVLFPAETVTAPWPRKVAEGGCPLRVEIPGTGLSYLQTAQAVDLPVLLASVHPDALGTRVHAYLRFPDGSSGYAISRQAIATISEQQLRDRILKVIAPDLVRHFTIQLKGSRP